MSYPPSAEEEAAVKARDLRLMHRTFCPDGECPICDDRRALRWAYVDEENV